MESKKNLTSIYTEEDLIRQKQRQERAQQLAWYALVVAPQHERQVLEALTGKPDEYKRGGKAARKNIASLQNPIEAYVPIRLEKHKWSDRTKIVPIVLIPSIVFVRIRLAESKTEILQLDECIKMFIYNKDKHEPEQIPDVQMQMLKDSVEKAEDLSIQTPVPGDTVQVMSGPFTGYVGEIIRVDGGTKFQLRLTHNLAGVFTMDLDRIRVVSPDTKTSFPDERFK